MLALLLLTVVHAQTQDAARPAWREVLRDLAPKLAAALLRTEPFDLSMEAASPSAAFDAAWAETVMATLLGSRNLKPAPHADPNTHVRITCSESLQGRVCAAEIIKGAAENVVLAARPFANGTAADAGETQPVAALTVRPVHAQRAPMLDAVLLDAQRMLVLDVNGVTAFGRTATGWKALDTKPVERTTAWPRDVRGRLTVLGNAFEAFLPGRACRGTVEPLDLACSDSRAAWPLGIENDGLAEGRNFFTSSRLPAFYSAARLQEAGEPAWLLSTVDGGLKLLDSHLKPVASLPGGGDDVVRISSECAPGRPVVLVGEESATGRVDGLKAFEITGNVRLPIATPVSLPGDLAALWPTTDGSTALAIVRNLDADRYEAFLVGISCAR